MDRLLACAKRFASAQIVERIDIARSAQILAERQPHMNLRRDRAIEKRHVVCVEVESPGFGLSETRRQINAAITEMYRARFQFFDDPARNAFRRWLSCVQMRLSSAVCAS